MCLRYSSAILSTSPFLVTGASVTRFQLPIHKNVDPQLDPPEYPSRNGLGCCPLAPHHDPSTCGVSRTTCACSSMSPDSIRSSIEGRAFGLRSFGLTSRETHQTPTYELFGSVRIIFQWHETSSGLYLSDQLAGAVVINMG